MKLLLALCAYAHTAHATPPAPTPKPALLNRCVWTRCELDDSGNRTDCRRERAIVDADSFAERIYIPGLLGQVPRYECEPVGEKGKAK